MGHHISAILLKGTFDEQRAKSFELIVIPLTAELSLFPLDARYTDYWVEKLGLSGFISTSPLLNSKVIHQMMNTIALNPLFAVIETDYFGGTGTQSAVVYHGKNEIMPPESNETGPINKALQLLGVIASNGRDEFDTVGLGQYRDFYDLFEGY